MTYVFVFILFVYWGFRARRQYLSLNGDQNGIGVKTNSYYNSYYYNKLLTNSYYYIIIVI